MTPLIFLNFIVFVLSLHDGYWSGFISAQLKSNGVIIAGTDGADEVIGKKLLLNIETDIVHTDTVFSFFDVGTKFNG